MTTRLPDAQQHLERLVGATVHTIAGERPNAIIAIEGDKVLVGTEKSPGGQHVEIAWIQEAIDRLKADGELEVTTAALGSPIGHRSALIGAVLREIEGVRVVSHHPARVALETRT
jgi:hypothetical protein